MLFVSMLVLAGATALPAQNQSAPAGTPTSAGSLVVGSGNFFSPIVANLDRAVAFYRDGLGLQVTGEPSNADTNAPLRNMFGLPDAHLRWTVARPAGVRNGVEIVEITGAQGQPLARALQDPGAMTLIVTVTDVTATLRRMQTLGGTVVTSSGAPLLASSSKDKDKVRAVVVRDRDDHFVEMRQPEMLPESASGVVDVRVRLTVDSLDRALKLYRDALGLHQLSVTAFAKDRVELDVLGVPRGEYRTASLQVPGSNLPIDLIEFRDIDRKTVQGRIQDPGSTRLQLQVRDLDAAIQAIVEAGGAVVSTGGAPVELPGGRGATIRAAIVRDPSNLFLVLIQAPQAPAPAAAR
jgi:catechol 2,3-dioxygenase-like lactoylglutathione lyase family enzyme